MRCFSSPGSLSTLWSDGIATAGLPHSEIRVSMDICSYTRLIAAYHVLLRLREPRHPSCALLSFPFMIKEKSALLFRLRLNLSAVSLKTAAKSARSLLLIRFVCSADSLSLRYCYRSDESVFCFQHVNVLSFRVVPGRVELPTSTLSV